MRSIDQASIATARPPGRGLGRGETATAPDAPTSIPYSLRIGIVGHRDLPDVPATAEAVRKLVTIIGRRLTDRGNATPLQWVAVSPLARGADRIGAEVILEQPGAVLEVVAPLPIEEYRRDFETHKDLAHFDRLLRTADGRVRIAAEAAPTPQDRELAYRAAGERIVDSSELVVAIWDGRFDRHSGTAQTVAYAIRSGRKVLWINPLDLDAGARLLRPARAERRQRAEAAKAIGFSPASLPQHRPQWSLGFVRLSAFNQQYRTCTPSLVRRMNRIQSTILSRARAAGLPEDAVKPFTTRLGPLAAKADLLAEWYQLWHRRGQRAMYCLAATAVTIAVFQLMVFQGDKKWILHFEIGALLLSIGLLWLSRRYFLHDRWLYSRYVAEQLRMAMYTLPLGCGRGRNRKSEGWELPLFAAADSQISHALWRYLQQVGASARASHDTDNFNRFKRFVIEGWIAEQASWHEQSARRKHHRAGRNHVITVVLFWSIIAFVAVYIAFDVKWMKFLAIVLPAWAAAWHGLSRQDEDHRVATRSTELSQRLAQIAARAEYANSYDELRAEADKAAEVMAAELQDWLVQASFHPPETVV